MEFGTLPSGVLGVACGRHDTQGRAVEADVRLDEASAKGSGGKPSDGKGRFGVEAVATQELGHVFGLGHVAESTSGNLTMSTQINGACQNAEATLGRGDVRALLEKCRARGRSPHVGARAPSSGRAGPRA